MSDEHDDDLIEKAKVLAEATGRSVADVLADLEDDGILNESNKQSNRSLVEELKEAAELITTVQAINQDVANNTVLNGGDNKTDVKVETTLEGDIVDRAIASVHRKAVEVKKIALIIAPIFLLISGGTLEGLGVINLMGDDSDSSSDYDDGYWDEYGGCLNPDAWNYDPAASWDDGSCQFDDGGGGGDCHSQIEWHLSDAYLDGSDAVNTHLFIYDANSCNNEWRGTMVVLLLRNGDYYLDNEWRNVVWWNDWEADWTFDDLDEGTYTVEVEFDEEGGSHWHWNVDGEFNVECKMDLSHDDSSAWNPESNNIEVNMKVENRDSCSGEVEVMISGYLNNTYQWSIEYGENDVYEVQSGTNNLTIRHQRLMNLESGEWSFETRIHTQEQGEICCIMTNSVEI
jgi:hypothetical protein